MPNIQRYKLEKNLKQKKNTQQAGALVAGCHFVGN